jgi:hypothetical protein
MPQLGEQVPVPRPVCQVSASAPDPRDRPCGSRPAVRAEDAVEVVLSLVSGA